MRSSAALAFAGSLLALLLACGSDDSGASIPPADGGASSSSGSSGEGGSASSSSSSSSSSSGSSGAGVDPAGCTAATAEICDYLAKCAPRLFEAGWADAASCKARAALECSINAKSPGATALDPGCATAVASASCDGLLVDAPASCRAKGTLTDGTACEADLQCASGACVKKPGAASPCGTCVARVPASGACDQGQKCDWGLVCAAGTCRVPGKKNDACVKGSCASPLRCAAGTCQDPLATDAACVTGGAYDDPCDGVNLAYCKQTTPPAPAGKCTQIALADDNAPCGIIGGGLVACKGSASCVGPNGSKTCQPKAADGAACDENLGPTCTDPADCIAGKCTLPAPDRCK